LRHSRLNSCKPDGLKEGTARRKNRRAGTPRYSFHVRGHDVSGEDIAGDVPAIPAAIAYAKKVAQELSDEAAYKTSSVIVVDEKGQEIARVPIAPSRSK
jgi:hypothetical protein